MPETTYKVWLSVEANRSDDDNPFALDELGFLPEPLTFSTWEETVTFMQSIVRLFSPENEGTSDWFPPGGRGHDERIEVRPREPELPQ